LQPCLTTDAHELTRACAARRYGTEVSVLEMDGQFDNLEELIYVESHLSNTSAKFYGEITQQMLKNSSFPGSKNGSGLFQTIAGLKIREVYERTTAKEVATSKA
jgi:phosphoribulokinase